MKKVMASDDIIFENTDPVITMSKGAYKDALTIAAGPCNLCGKCLLPDGKECPHPKDRFFCLSAYSIDVMELSKACGMELSWGMGHIAYFSMVLF